ncbi:MAG TPA: hypothetical protein VGK46_13930 [Saprospiraceae bacterium]
MAAKHFPFEHKDLPLLSKTAFIRRQLIFIFYAILMLAFSLGIGMVGYKSTTGMAWIDAFYNASMILTGMGPIDVMPTHTAKIFAGCYALFSGVIFLSTVAVMFTPLVHRFLHLMHIDDDDKDS